MPKYPASSTRLLVNVGVEESVSTCCHASESQLLQNLMTVILVHIQVIQDMPVGAVNRHLAYKIVVKSHTWKNTGKFRIVELMMAAVCLHHFGFQLIRFQRLEFYCTEYTSHKPTHSLPQLKMVLAHRHYQGHLRTRVNSPALL
jgi:hypothetical protein